MPEVNDYTTSRLRMLSYFIICSYVFRPLCAQVVLKVEMPCSGCSGAVERVLKKMEGEHCI